MELATTREKDYPEDALLIYQGQIEPIVNQKNNDAYREAVSLLRKVCDLNTRLGRQDEFTRYLDSLRTAHKPKRNFMKLIEQTRWPTESP